MNVIHRIFYNKDKDLNKIRKDLTYLFIKEKRSYKQSYRILIIIIIRSLYIKIDLIFITSRSFSHSHLTNLINPTSSIYSFFAFVLEPN